eukprot:CAMPEP_0185254790 /NCGR_PEP_ID=MMETSP1359-20130426/3721_1 /TAXON_ID=552665 /ORGANISM="Bigelowiella longifila, Strain CCMP242" /LENGTH=334 /DNA_ID=CAMNT_0027838167 /DNA_START=134 /DNA_END=1138 /DNA_ORIENTATION=+
MTVYQWGVINHHSRINKLAKDMFESHISIYGCVMVAIVGIIFGSFGVFLFFIDDVQLRIVGPVAMATMTLLLSGGVLYYGRATLGIMGKIKRSRRLMSVTAFVHIFSVCLAAQAIVYLIAASISLEESVTLTALTAFYLADILMVMLQLDYISGLHATTFFVSISFSVLDSVKSSTNGSHSTRATKSSRNNTAGTAGSSGARGSMMMLPRGGGKGHRKGPSQHSQHLSLSGQHNSKKHRREPWSTGGSQENILIPPSPTAREIKSIKEHPRASTTRSKTCDSDTNLSQVMSSESPLLHFSGAATGVAPPPPPLRTKSKYNSLTLSSDINNSPVD